ncbi:MAG: endopeptidase La [Clostridiales bacterium]|nr:endopeptidase La [Clostridiales bacterium]
MEIFTNEIIELPLLALKGLVVFPAAQMHFDVVREKSVAAIKDAMDGNRKIFLVAQRDITVDDPAVDQLYEKGVIANINQVFRLPNSNNLRVYVEGIERALLISYTQVKPCFKASVLPCIKKTEGGNKVLACIRKTKALFDEYMETAPQLPGDIVLSVMAEDDPGRLADYIAGNIMLDYKDKQSILDELVPTSRLEKLCAVLTREIELIKLEGDITERVQEQIDENQREYYLREQLKIISSELNGGISPEEEIDEFRYKIYKLHFPEDIEEKLLRECDRLERMSPQSPEGTVARTYIETVLDLPWNKYTKDKINLEAARKILDNDHYGLEKVKDRIIEALAVYKLSGNISGQLLCLVGPPGVGKTSVARSVARAMGRKYVRISLGGIYDEAEIRGHRRTYIGSMPGRIIAAIQQAGTSNPLILLDEIDKLGKDFRGDPSSALLEVMDGEQNFSFRDHYIEIPFDLSKVMFVTTANDTSTIHPALLDRMEVIELGSYTQEEKFNIAKKHLVKKQIKRSGLTSKELKISDGALRKIIESYTRESGVRKLEQCIAKICRKTASEIAAGKEKVSVTEKNLEKYLGTAKYHRESYEKNDLPGIVNGLAWTAVGGETLKVEAAVMDGSSKLELTGSLGDVMKESAHAAISYIRSNAAALNIDPDFYGKKDIHIHVPEGAVPKDGPSAGVTIATALVSALSDTPVKHNVAMTGEITLRGRVLPIGGLREKAMAAYLAGIDTVIIPADNTGDLDEVDDVVRSAVKFIPVSGVGEVFNAALVKGH